MLTAAVQDKKIAKRLLLAQTSREHLIQFKRCKAEVKLEVGIAKRASWENYCNT
jgi:hypothetical protein